MGRSDTRSDRIGRAILVAAGAVVMRILGATWRLHTSGPDPFASGVRPVIGALWHRGVFLAAHQFRDRRVVVIVSRSRDGDWIDALLAKLGYAPSPRGSTSRGGAQALRQQIRVTRETGIGAILPDGPRGPAQKAKPGVIFLAGACQAPLWPVGFSARPAVRFRSWDRMLLPLPFARVACVYGDPLVVPRDADDDTREVLRAELERRLDALTAEADQRVGRADPERDGPSVS